MVIECIKVKECKLNLQGAQISIRFNKVSNNFGLSTIQSSIYLDDITFNTHLHELENSQCIATYIIYVKTQEVLPYLLIVGTHIA